MSTPPSPHVTSPGTVPTPPTLSAEEQLLQLQAHLQQREAQWQHEYGLLQAKQQANPQANLQQVLETLAALQNRMVQQLQQSPPQQAPAQDTAQLLALQSTLPQLRPYGGQGVGSGLKAQEWLNHCERVFTAREDMLKLGAGPETDRLRVLLASTSLTDAASVWWDALPITSQPSTWDAFKVALMRRFQPLPAIHIRQDQLTKVVAMAEKINRTRRMTPEGVIAYSDKFLEIASLIPSQYTTDHDKLREYCKGLPPDLAKHVMTRMYEDQRPSLNTVIESVIRRASFNTAAQMASSGPSPHSDAMDLSAVEIHRVAEVFGVSMDKAATIYLEPAEGWAPHDTATSSGTSATLASMRPSNPPASRRTIPNKRLEGIPEELIKARKEADLCARCGVTKYTPGSKGHNARTCLMEANKTTSVSEGKRKAGF